MSVVMNLLQKRVFEILDRDGTLATYVGERIYDNVPELETFPYIVIGEDQFTDFSSHTFDGFQGTITVRTWTEKRGRKQAKDIMAAIYSALNNKDLGINGFTTIVMRLDLAETIVEADNITVQGIMKFNFTVTP